MANWTVAFAGTGEVTPENATALLDDWLPIEGVELLFPKVSRRDKTLQALVKWGKDEEIDVHEDQEQLVDKLVELRNGGDEVYLVLAWDESESSSKLLEQALEAEVPVKDLTRALDDLEFEDETVPDPVSEPEPTGRRSRKKADDDKRGDPPWDTSGEDSNGVVHVSVAAPDTDNAPVQPAKGDVVQATTTGPAVLAPDARLPEGADPANIFGVIIGDMIREIVRDEYAKLTAKPEEATIPVLIDPDGNYRLGGKGRPRKGETATKLTPTEALAVGIELPEDE